MAHVVDDFERGRDREPPPQLEINQIKTHFSDFVRIVVESYASRRQPRGLKGPRRDAE